MVTLLNAEAEADLFSSVSSECVPLEDIWGVGDGSKMYEDSTITVLPTEEGIGTREIWVDDLQLDNHEGDVIGTSTGMCTLLAPPDDPAAQVQCNMQFTITGQGTITFQGNAPYNLDDAGWPTPWAITGGTGCYENIIGGTIHVYPGNNTSEFDHFTYTLERLIDVSSTSGASGLLLSSQIAPTLLLLMISVLQLV